MINIEGDHVDIEEVIKAVSVEPDIKIEVEVLGIQNGSAIAQSGEKKIVQSKRMVINDISDKLPSHFTRFYS